jgi:cAMP phosphodiesterase
MRLCRYFILLLLCYPVALTAQINKQQTFKIVPLGVKGGSDESNLSAYMLAPIATNNYVCLDAGTINFGITKAIKAGIFKASPANVLKNYIKGYLISHAHLDHTAGLIINSPDDTAKNIYGLPFCLDILKDKYFNWRSWANFANEGDKPTLNKYHYTVLSSDEETALDNTGMFAKAYTLSHSNPYESTAFLIRKDSSYILYLGDTGADEIEKSDKLHDLWQEVALLITTKKLKGIFIEASFPNEQPDKQLFGHLTPRLLMQEMKNLSALAGKDAMKGLNVLITHIKPSGNHEGEIKQQLLSLNTLKLHLIFPRQAEVIRL